MSRLRSLFAGGEKKLIPYVTCGDPSLDDTFEIVKAAAGAGADCVELGVPFSDPSADGPAIQRAMKRALDGGASLDGALDVVRRLRRSGCDIPVVLFGYYNPIFVRGVDAFVRQATDAGADGVLVVDMPVDELDELAVPARDRGLEVIPLLAPTSTEARIDKVARLGPPFVYYVSITGITGAALSAVGDIETRVAAIRERARAPVAVGFGIATPDDVRTIGAFADACVVGSAICRRIEESPGNEANAVAELVRSLKEAL